MTKVIYNISKYILRNHFEIQNTAEIQTQKIIRLILLKNNLYKYFNLKIK